MSEEYIPCQETNRDEWVTWKSRKIGGHHAAAILGVHPYLTIEQVYDLIVHGIEPRVFTNEDRDFLDWRADLEPNIVARYTKLTGRKTRRTKSRVHPALPVCVASPDREILGDERGVGLLEAKSVYPAIWKKMEMDGLDKFMWVQNQHYLWVRNDPWGDICACDVSSGKPLTFEHPADREFHATLENRIREFLSLVESGTRPEETPDPVRIPDTGGDLVRVETMEEQAVTLFRKLSEDVVVCTSMHKETEALKKESRSRLERFMLETGMDVAQLGTMRAYCREQAGKVKYSEWVKAIRRKHPGIEIDDCKVVGDPSRVLRVYPNIKEND